MIGVTATATTPTLDTWRRRLAGGVAQRIATAAATTQQMRARADAPVATGALHVSISVQTPTGGDYAANVSDAQALRPAAQFFPEPPAPEPDSARALVGAAYGGLVNDGTLHQPARPFWDQAALETEAAIGALAEQAWRAAP